MYVQDSMNAMKHRLDREEIAYVALTGDMTALKRKQMLDSFAADPSCTVFLLSVRSGTAGLTLTAARYVYILEPCLNPAVTAQVRPCGCR